MSGQPYNSSADNGYHASEESENIFSMFPTSEFSPFYRAQDASQYNGVQAPFHYSFSTPDDPHPYKPYPSTMDNAQYLSRARQNLSHSYRTHRAATSCSSQDQSLFSSASSRQSFLPSNPSGSNSPADHAFPAAPRSHTNMSSPLDSSFEMGINALGLAPGRPITPPQFGQATLATSQPTPGLCGDPLAQLNVWDMFEAQSGLAPPAEICNRDLEPIGSFQGSQIVQPEQLGHQIAEGDANLRGTSMSRDSSSQSNSTVHPPTPAPAPHKLANPPPSRRVTKPKAKRGFPYARSAHIKTIENAHKETAYKRGPWTDDEEKVLREVSVDYDLQFMFKYGNEAIIDPVEKRSCIVEEIEAALPTFRTPHMILIQAAEMKLKPSTTTLARKEKQELKQELKKRKAT